MEPIKKLVKQATTQIERERDHFAASLNITGTQMSVIDFLSNMTDYTASQNEIEQEFDIRRSTTTIMVQRMEKRGLVERIASPSDKRQKLVKLTDKSQTLVQKIHEYMKQDDIKLRANFTDEELEITRKVLNVIKNG